MRVMEREREREAGSDGGTGDGGESLLNLTQTTGSDRSVTSAQALLRMEGWREKRREAGDDALREARMRGDIKRRGRTHRHTHTQKQASNKRPTTYIWA